MTILKISAHLKRVAYITFKSVGEKKEKKIDKHLAKIWATIECPCLYDSQGTIQREKSDSHKHLTVKSTFTSFTRFLFWIYEFLARYLTD